MLKVAPEGYSFMAVFSVIALAAALLLGPMWATLPLSLALFMVFFFRDPERKTPDGPGYLSPADGRVVSMGLEHEPEHLKGEALKISVFMSPLNVHVNRSPCAGEVARVRHTPGSFRAAYRDEASWKNENTAVLIKCDGGDILVRQVAGFLARRTVCRARPGDFLERGQRFGIIKFSSRLDVYLPPDAEAKVKLNDRVRAGETVLALPGGGK